MRVAIIQSSYVPWKGYFDIIRGVDRFILLDDVQYSRGDWRNRNRIKTAQGLKWISIPLRHSGTFPELIQHMRVSDPRWHRSHASLIEQAYKGAPGWPVLRTWLREHLQTVESESLSEINEALLRSLCGLLRIDTPIVQSTIYGVREEDPTARVVALCKAAGAATYVSGPSASAYIDTARFEQAGIALEYFDYSGYPEYPQPHGPFVHGVSIIDTIACLGADAWQALRRAP